MSSQHDDLPPEASGSAHLAIAFRAHADPALMKRYHETKARLDREGRWQYVGGRRSPDGYVLSDFDGNGHELLRESQEILVRIEGALMSKLRRGELTAWAREGSPLAPWRAIPASAWRSLKLGDIIKGTAKGPGVELFDIRIGERVVPPAPVAMPPLPETGSPGRPSHMHLIVAEFERRSEAGQLEGSLARESATLAAWFRVNHRDKQPVTAKAIENRIRKDYRVAQDKAA